jgi:hypothetical protein
VALKKRTAWVAVVFVALMISGCGTADSNDPPLKPPSVYRDPQVRVTHAPTEIVLVPSTIEASTSATLEPGVVIEPVAGPTTDEQQFLMDEIERLLTKIEGKLDRMDVNP